MNNDIKFNGKIMQIDFNDGRPLWLQPMIFAYSKQGVKTRIISKIFTFREEQLYTITDNNLWYREEVKQNIIGLGHSDTRQKAIKFFQQRITSFIMSIENIKDVECSYTDEKKMTFNYSFFNEKNIEEKDILDFSYNMLKIY